MPEYILVIDTGCAFIKTAIFDLEGKEIGETKTNLPFTYTHPNQYTRDLDKVWDTITKLIKKVLVLSNVSPNDIIGVTSVGYGNGLILLDKDGRPSCGAIASRDSRAKDLVQELFDQEDERKLRQYTLQTVWAGQSTMILKWLDLYNPEIIHKSTHLLLAKDYSNYRLTGNISTDKTDISAVSLYNVKEHRYDDRLLDLLGILKYKHLLPEVKKSTDLHGHITEVAAVETGLNAGTPVITGICDVVGSSLASGLVNTKNKENLLLNILAGSWTVDQYLTTTPQVEDRIFSTRIHPNKNHWTVSENRATSTSNIDWYIENFLPKERLRAEKEGISIFELTNRALASTKPEDTDIVFLPFIFGSNIGSEIKNGSELKATFFNLRMSDKQEHIIRAIYEGLTFSHLYQLHNMFTSIPQTLLVKLSGGGSASREWAQMFADTLQVPVETTKCTNTNALGAAICASIGLGRYNTFEEAVEKMTHFNERIDPNPENKDIYADKFFKYTSLISKLTGTPYNYY